MKLLSVIAAINSSLPKFLLFVCLTTASFLDAQVYAFSVSAPGQCLTSLRTTPGKNTIDLFIICSPVEKPLFLSMTDTTFAADADKVTIFLIHKDTITHFFQLTKTTLPKDIFPATNADWRKGGINVLAHVEQKKKLLLFRKCTWMEYFNCFFLIQLIFH